MAKGDNDLAKVGVEGSNPFARSSPHVGIGALVSVVETSVSLRASRSFTISTTSEQSKLGLSRTARLFVSSYRSRMAIRIHARLPTRPDVHGESELARFVTPRRRSS